MAKKEAASTPAKVEKTENPEKFSVSEFFKGTREELDKVVWPSRQQLISESVAVVSMVILSATIIYFVDQLFGWAAGRLFG